MERVLFTSYPEHDFGREAPMDEAPFYKWATDNVSVTDRTNDLEVIKEYLSTKGFDLSKHYLSTRGLYNLKSILERNYYLRDKRGKRRL